MKNKKEIQDELSELSPILSKMKREQGEPFNVPHNYFEQLSDDIMARLEDEKPAPQVVEQGPSWIDRLLNSLAVLLQPRMAVAFASMALLLVAAFFFVQTSGEQTTTLAVADGDISEQEIAAYVEANIDDFETDLLFAEAYTQEEATEGSDIDLEDAELDEYLDDIIDELDDSELEQLL